MSQIEEEPRNLYNTSVESGEIVSICETILIRISIRRSYLLLSGPLCPGLWPQFRCRQPFLAVGRHREQTYSRDFWHHSASRTSCWSVYQLHVSVIFPLETEDRTQVNSRRREAIIFYDTSPRPEIGMRTAYAGFPFCSGACPG